MLKGVLGHADLAVPVDGRNRQVGNALGLQVKRHSIPGGDAALELELDGRGPRQIDHHALAPRGATRMASRASSSSSCAGTTASASSPAVAPRPRSTCSIRPKVPYARKLQALLPAERHVKALA